MKALEPLEATQESFLTIIPTKPSALDHTESIHAFIEDGLQQGDLNRDFPTRISYLEDAQLKAPLHEPLNSCFQLPTPEWLSLSGHADQIQSLRGGPYAITDGALWQVSKLYDDTHGTFMVTVQPQQAKYSCTPMG